MSLCAKAVKVGETVEANCFQFLHRDLAVMVLVNFVKDNLHYGIRLLLVLNVVL